MIEKTYSVFERLLDERGIRAADVAKATGLGKSTLSSWKNGTSMPKSDKLFAIASYFGVPMETFFGSEPSDRIVHYGKAVYEVAGGEGRVNSDYSDDEIAEALSDEYVYCTVKGDSMYPTLQDGDVVQVHLQTETTPQDITIVKVDGETATAKRVEIVKDGIWLRADNKEVYADRFYSVQEVLTLPITIVGKAVALKRGL